MSCLVGSQSSVFFRVPVAPPLALSKVDNCNMVVALAREMDLVTVNIGGTDLVDGNKTLILAV